MKYNLKKKLNIARVRSKVSGTAERPRLAVTVSNRHIRAQIINDEQAKSLAFADSSVASHKSKAVSKRQKAELVGTDIAAKAKSAKVTRVVFDRRNRRYHGIVKLVGETAKKNGLEF